MFFEGCLSHFGCYLWSGWDFNFAPRIVCEIQAFYMKHNLDGWEIMDVLFFVFWWITRACIKKCQKRGGAPYVYRLYTQNTTILAPTCTRFACNKPSYPHGCLVLLKFLSSMFLRMGLEVLIVGFWIWGNSFRSFFNLINCLFYGSFLVKKQCSAYVI